MTGNFNSSKLDNATLSVLKDGNTSIIISVAYMIITAVNLVGNGLSMWLLLFRTSPKTPSIIFMINLTLTDLALGTALPFQIAYQLQGYNWNLGPRMCSALTLIFYTNMYCSILTMMAIGIDRYLGIVRPMLFRQTRERKSIAVISCLLMWGLVLANIIFYTNMYCSILTMMAAGVDRYLGIVRPCLFRQTRERKSAAVIGCLLMWGLVLSRSISADDHRLDLCNS
ncbi:P2Y purinoceptor 8-like protein [Lates japonicus]|uniref:P2Y purinoceptor 8-like protein n=1 Tax=Lates japonicus TaxID=270547 RepID=A0AAD3MDZ4_LATJO|nr:P2Y purinoceptor 8-like protein [Lates japonicus]